MHACGNELNSQASRGVLSDTATHAIRLVWPASFRALVNGHVWI